MPTPRLVPSLVKLREQANAAAPNRSKVSDGWVGDPAHASRTSDHNPDGDGWVRAIDLTNDPVNGFDAWLVAETLRLNRDPRIAYVISNGKIFSSTVSPWTWRTYSGVNPHIKHMHVSASPAGQHDTSAWDLKRDLQGAGVPEPKPKAPDPGPIRADMARQIRRREARVDRDGHVMVHVVGDGSKEVAGINERSHPDATRNLIRLVEAGDNSAVEAMVDKYTLEYTDFVRSWHPDLGVEFYLRDTAFNRGPTGAAKILQEAVRVDVDGQVGPTTRGAAAAIPVAELLTRLRAARESYEIATYGRREKLWSGLVNRWDLAIADAKEFSRRGTSTVARDVVVGTVAAGTAGGAAAGAAYGIDWTSVVLILVIGASIAVVVRRLWRKKD
jgi:hypothetical protein